MKTYSKPSIVTTIIEVESMIAGSGEPGNNGSAPEMQERRGSWGNLWDNGEGE